MKKNINNNFVNYEINHKLQIDGSYIKNQQRFPISKFGWPLKEASETIIKGEGGWEVSAKEIVQNFIEKRKRMVSLSEIYNLNCLKKWSINCSFIPWFSHKPILNKIIYDKDYLNIEATFIVNNLCQLIKNFEKNGFVENEKIEKNIIVYPLDKEKKYYYVRAGNHRVAVLAALGSKIPCILDNISYFKSRYKIMLAKYFLNIRTYKIYRNYPYIRPYESWPSVKSKVISKEDALNIMNLFYS